MNMNNYLIMKPLEYVQKRTQIFSKREAKRLKLDRGCNKLNNFIYLFIYSYEFFFFTIYQHPSSWVRPYIYTIEN